MASVAVVTDSTVCLSTELMSSLGIESVPLRFFLNGRTYLDGLEITADEIYRLLPQARTLPTTSAPTPSDYYAAYERAAASHSAILVVTITRKFSAMYQSALTAAETARRSLAGVSIEVLDSHTTAGAQGLVVLAAARAAQRGADLPAVVRAASDVMARVDLIAYLGTLYYLAKSGRVPMALHWANSVVRVNPLFRVGPMSGEARTVRIARGRAGAERQLLEIVGAEAGTSPLHGIVFHSYCPDEAGRLKRRVESSFHCVELLVSDFTPAMGVHTGPGVLGLAYYVDR